MSQFETTPEKHGAVPLHSEGLGNAINCRAELLQNTEDSKLVPKKDGFGAKMMGDQQKFLWEGSGLGMPCLPFTKRVQAENMLFNRLMIERSGHFNEQEICLKWVNHCDGKLKFLQSYHSTCELTIVQELEM
jgi:hypothetical protein